MADTHRDELARILARLYQAQADLSQHSKLVKAEKAKRRIARIRSMLRRSLVEAEAIRKKLSGN